MSFAYGALQIRVLLLFLLLLLLNSRGYKILESKQVRPQRRLLGGESAVEGDRITPLKSHWHPLEQVSRLPGYYYYYTNFSNPVPESPWAR